MTLPEKLIERIEFCNNQIKSLKDDYLSDKILMDEYLHDSIYYRAKISAYEDILSLTKFCSK